MYRTLVILALMCASLQAQVTGVSIATAAAPSVAGSAPSVNPVIEWNKTPLVIVAGQHFRTDHMTGTGLGTKVAENWIITTPARRY